MDSPTKASEREIVQVKTLRDMRIEKATIEYDIGPEFPKFMIPIRFLTYAEWVACAREIPAPTPPNFGGTKGTVYDYQAPSYIQEVQTYNDKVMYRRLARCLMVEFEGITDQEKVAEIEKELGAGAAKTVYWILDSYHDRRMAQVTNRAHTFHNGTVAHPKNDEPSEHPDDGSV